MPLLPHTKQLQPLGIVELFHPAGLACADNLLILTQTGPHTPSLLKGFSAPPSLIACEVCRKWGAGKAVCQQLPY